MSCIEFDGVSKTFGERAVVKELSLQIERAERLVLLGPSGCGKTSVIELTNRRPRESKARLSRVRERI